MSLTERWSASQAGRWFNGREPREQLFLSAAAALILLAIAYLAVWQPVASWRDASVGAAVRLQSDLAYMQRTLPAAQARARASQPERGQSRPRLKTITDTARAAGLSISQYRPSGDSYEITLDGKPFNDILQWLDSLAQNNGITVIEASISADSTPGYVRARISLR